MTVTPSARRGVCPGLDTPMQTGDGLVARLTPVSGAFSVSEIREVATLAECHGNGILEVSMRGNLQVRGLDAQTAPRFAQGVRAVGIVPHSGIAIDISPLSGLDPREVADARTVAYEIRAELAKAHWSTDLAPKTSVVIDGGGQITLADLIADIRIVAADGGPEGEPGWQLYTGDTESRSRDRGFVRDDAGAVTAVVALLERLAAKGNGARGRDLDDGYLSAVSRFLGATAIPNFLDRNRSPAIGLLPLNDGSFAVGFRLELGTIGAQALTSFADLIAQATSGRATGGSAPIRLAPNKIVLVVVPDAASAKALQDGARDLGLICDAADPRSRLVTCAGAPACASAYLDTHSLARAVQADCGDFLDDASVLEGGQIHISGCEKNCAKPRGAAIDIIGGADGSDVFFKGCLQASCVAPADMSVVIRKLIARS